MNALMTNYGFTESFKNEAENLKYDIKNFEHLSPARILSQEKGFYRIICEKGEKLAQISGKFRFRTVSPADYPAVGDFVLIHRNDDGDTAIIESILPRKSCFLRKAAGIIQQEQVVAANIDTVFLCMALNNDFNLRRLERYISIGWDSGATPVIVLTKSDLCDDLGARLTDVASVAPGVDVVVTTAVKNDGYAELLPFISAGKTVAFIGSSGVGKSSLINCLTGEDLQKTNDLRNDDKGRHTTTRRQMMMLSNGCMLIDTPGMRELGMWDNQSGIEKTFEDIEALSLSCRFRDCSHSGEPGCAIKKALADGELTAERWQSYQKLRAENAYTKKQKSYMSAKGKREKEISKLIKKLPVKK